MWWRRKVFRIYQNDQYFMWRKIIVLNLSHTDTNYTYQPVQAASHLTATLTELRLYGTNYPRTKLILTPWWLALSPL